MGISDLTDKWVKKTVQKRRAAIKAKIMSDQEEVDYLIEQVRAGEHYLAVYPLYLRSQYWRRIRLEVLRRDKFACVQCQSKKDLHVDHIRYGEWGNEKLEDLQTLCRVCHQKKTTHYVLVDGKKFKMEDGQLFAVLRK